MIEELILRGYAEKTRELYVKWMIRFSAYWGRGPDRLEADHIRGYLLHLHEQGKAESTINQAVNAIRFFYREVLRAPLDVKADIPRVKAVKRVHRAYSVPQIEALLAAARPDPLAHALFSTLYHTGMRLGEVCALRFTEIERGNQRILVKEGKGKKDRYTLLPERLEGDLERYWLEHRKRYGLKRPWVFLGRRAIHKPIPQGSVQELFYRYRERARLPEVGGVHLLRHSFASHQLMAGISLEELRQAMGHRSLKTTLRYLHHLAGGHHLYQRRISPLDCLDSDSPLAGSEPGPAPRC